MIARTGLIINSADTQRNRTAARLALHKAFYRGNVSRYEERKFIFVNHLDKGVSDAIETKDDNAAEFDPRFNGNGGRGQALRLTGKDLRGL